MTKATPKTSNILVIGAGAWGTALAHICAQSGNQVTLYGRDPNVIYAINSDHQNPKYLPDQTLNSNINAIHDLDIIDSQAFDFVFLVTPAQTLRSVLSECKDKLRIKDKLRTLPLVICAKGIEQSSGKLLSEVVMDICPDAPIAALSGPSFADDAVSNLPTAVTIASKDITLAKAIAESIKSQNFRPYISDDLDGVLIGGALKNCLAIAVGIAVGLKLGASAKAALTSRGFAEMKRFAQKFDAQEQTLMGLSGLGDLVLTCSSTQSRNFSYGMAIGENKTRPEKLAEGAYTAKIACRKANDIGVELPIINMVAKLLDGDIDPMQAVQNLMARELRHENEQN